MRSNGPERMFSRILVPTDFSMGSKEAWAIARRMSCELGAELVLLHVLPATPLDVEAMVAEEEHRAEIRGLQAAHQLGIPRADEDAVAPSHVFEGPFVGAAVGEFSTAGQEWAARLERWGEDARTDGAKVTTVLRVGVPYQEILASVKDEHADLVVMATHGRGKIHRLLVGSVADKVIRMAPCPVLTIREN